MWSPPQREQMCWKWHGMVTHARPSFHAKHAVTRRLFGFGADPLSVEGLWVAFCVPLELADKRHLVCTMPGPGAQTPLFPAKAPAAGSESCMHATSLPFPHRIGLWQGMPISPQLCQDGIGRRCPQIGKRPSPIPSNLLPVVACGLALAYCLPHRASDGVPLSGFPPPTSPYQRSPP